MRLFALLAIIALSGCLEASPPQEAGPPAAPAPTVEQPVPQGTIPSTPYVEQLHDPSGIQHVILMMHEAAGYGLLDDALDGVAAELAWALQKNVSWSRAAIDAPGSPSTRWSGGELGHWAATVFATPWPEGAILLHSVSLPGCYKTSSRDCVGGVEIGNVGFVFMDEKRDESSLELLRAHPYVGEHNIQRYIVLHELGHAMGLVHREVPALNQDRLTDDACRCHSTNEHSVMRGRGGTNISGDIEHDLDELEDIIQDRRWNDGYDDDDIADLRAFQAMLAQR